jgi:hypothetical protein
MARTPIHPGEHLAEELKELRISAPVSLTAGARSRPIPRYGLATGLAPARNFGSICKNYSNCGWHAKKSAIVWKNFLS